MGDLRQKLEQVRGRLDQVKRRFRLAPYLNPVMEEGDEDSDPVQNSDGVAEELIDILGDTLEIVGGLRQLTGRPDPEVERPIHKLIPIREVYSERRQEAVNEEESSREASEISERSIETMPLERRGKATFRVVNDEVVEVGESSEDEENLRDANPYSPSTPSYQGSLVEGWQEIKKRFSLRSGETKPNRPPKMIEPLDALVLCWSSDSDLEAEPD